ncbi:hypothetical protein D8I24_4374 [Cupriavidus necator H850]|uniref:hypothetical protein n=1 Tax=Cupriavidus necator TaxID=106590 RepID=UPI00129E333F|nr:hypothetical protein [Cupriavidus necator]KAI3600616.1 hypothetical protein D8I24_4374 [Cupriavidus necator H850]
MDLLEIQQLHAQYIRQPLTIDMPASVGLGIPLSLPSPSEAATAAPTQWKALAGRGRNLLLVLGGLGVAAAIGMSVASRTHRGATANDQQDASVVTAGQMAAATPALAATPEAAIPVTQSPAPSSTPTANLTVDSLAPATPRFAERPDEPRSVQPQPASASPGTAQSPARRPAAVTTPPVNVKATPGAPNRSPAQKPAAQHAGDIKLF